ncbi:MAG: Spx/MgsR family RNA polymerase-binding regulatory protein [Cyanobacteria bacterium P01_A01_bin.135]
MTYQLYGIPNCGTCKKAIAWLETNDISYEFINTKEQPPSEAQIQQWVSDIGFKPMRNTSGQSYRALGEVRNTWGDDQWVEAFSKDAMLLKRPLWVKDGTAVMAGFRGSEEKIRQTLGL